MTRIFVELPIFRSRWKDLGLNDSDLRRLQEELLADPKIGDVMRKTGGIRKMRFAFEKRGKSGSVRVIYVDFEVYEKIFCSPHMLRMRRIIYLMRNVMN